MPLGIEDYRKHKSTVINSIESILIDQSDVFADEMQAFIFYTADSFAGSTEEEYFTITDGKSDQGIDFYTNIDGTYEIFQCKFEYFDTIIREDKPIKFNQDCVKEIENSYKYLVSDTVQSTGNDKVKILRALLRSDGYSEISFNLCIFGELTDDAKQKYEILKRDYENETIKFNLYTWSDIIELLLQRSKYPREIRFKFRVFDKQLLSKNDYSYFLTYAKDFYSLFKEYGWSLFDLNVRYELKNSSINKSIVKSLAHSKSMKYFHHLNNGILIFCDSYTKKGHDEFVEVKNLQIINGCQTVLSIQKAFKEISNDNDKLTTFNDKCFVQVKIIKNVQNVPELIDQLIVSTNNQNPMSKRNLKSNTSEQKEIKLHFENFKHKWFYQRKDGEFESLRNTNIQHNGFRISDFKNGNIYRYIDNNDLAKSWISFIGFSDVAILNADYFNNTRLYCVIFASYPNENLWNDFINPGKLININNDDYFVLDKKPSTEEYLLSFLIWRFIREFTPSPSANRKGAIERAVQNGKIKKNNEGRIIDSPEIQAQCLLDDTEYMVNNIINNSKEILIEMFSFILIGKYGFGYEIARNILRLPTFEHLVSKPDYTSFISDIRSRREAKDITLKDNIIFCIYEYLKYSINQLYAEIKSDYIAAPRRKTYLASPLYKQKLKIKILEVNSSPEFIGLIKEFKKINKTFLDSLPDLN